MQTHDRPVLTCTRARQTRTHHNPRPHQNLPDITAGYPDQQLLMSGLISVSRWTRVFSCVGWDILMKFELGGEKFPRDRT